MALPDLADSTPPGVLSPERLGALWQLEILDTPAEESFDRLTRLAATLLDAPVALVSLVDKERQFFKSCFGLRGPQATARQGSVSDSFCQHVVGTAEPLIITDARDHPLLRDYPGVRSLDVVAYAGIPLATYEGHVLGSFCVIDRRPRNWSDHEIAALRDLAAAAMTEIELRAATRAAEQQSIALRHSEERFRTAFEHAAIGMALVDLNGRWLQANAAFCEFTGYPANELLTMTFQDITHPGDLEKELTEVRQLLSGEIRSYRMEKRYIRRDGSVVWGLLSRALVRDEDGSPIHFISQVEDVTARKRAEEALRASEARFRTLFDHAPAMFVLTSDRDGTPIVADCNELFLTTLGYARDEVIGRPVADFYSPASLSALSTDGGYQRVLGGGAATAERELIAKDLRVVEALLRAQPDRGPDRTISGTVAMFVDISDRKRAEAMLARTLRDLEDRTQALEAKTREQDAFVYTVSHDLRAPLVSLHGLASILLEDHAADLPEDARQCLDRIIANADKMQALITDLLDLSRVGRVDIDFGVVDLDAVVRDVMAQLHHTLAARNARVQITGQLPVICANHIRMVQLFTNLIANAVAYTPTDRTPNVQIAAIEEPDTWEITVADNGVGIPDEWQEKVFGVFQRLPVGKALNPSGSGVGLAIVSRIVESHNGRLWLDSSEGVGTTFHLSFPKDRADGANQLGSGDIEITQGTRR